MITYKTSRPTSGEFQIITRRNAYYLRLRQGIVCDVAPVLRGAFLYREVGELLAAIYRREGAYEVRRVVSKD